MKEQLEPQEPQELQEPPYAWVVVWAAFVNLAVIFGVAYSFAAFFESFSTEFHAQRADVSLIFGLSGLVYFVLGAGAGMLADRYGPRVVCCAGMLCIAAALLASSFVNSMAMIYLFYGVGIGIGVALVYTPAIACVQPWFSQRRGLAAGIASAGIGAGTVVIPLLAAAAIIAFDWRTALRAITLGVLVIGLGAAYLLRRAPSTGVSKGRAAGFSVSEALHDRRFWWLYLATVAASPTMFIPFAHISAAARDLGINESHAVGLVGLIGIGSLVGRFVIGTLADRIGRTLALSLMQASMGLSYLIWFGADGFAALAFYALWFGISYGGIVALLPALCMDLFGARAVAGIIGTLYTGAAFGNLLGPVIAGALFDRNGIYTLVIWICIALSSLATLASARLISSHQPAY